MKNEPRRMEKSMSTRMEHHGGFPGGRGSLRSLGGLVVGGDCEAQVRIGIHIPSVMVDVEARHSR